MKLIKRIKSAPVFPPSEEGPIVAGVDLSWAGTFTVSDAATDKAVNAAKDAIADMVAAKIDKGMLSSYQAPSLLEQCKFANAPLKTPPHVTESAMQVTPQKAAFGQMSVGAWRAQITSIDLTDPNWPRVTLFVLCGSDAGKYMTFRVGDELSITYQISIT